MTKIKSREEMAREALSHYQQTDWTYDNCPEWIMDASTGANYEKGIDQNEIIGFLHGFIKGFEACKKLMMEEASKVFEQWFRVNGNFFEEDDYVTNDLIRDWQEGAWTAARLSTLAECEEREKELKKDLESSLEIIERVLRLHPYVDIDEEAKEIRTKHFGEKENNESRKQS
jgi:hypothetical protein